MINIMNSDSEMNIQCKRLSPLFKFTAPMKRNVSYKSSQLQIIRLAGINVRLSLLSAQPRRPGYILFRLPNLYKKKKMRQCVFALYFSYRVSQRLKFGSYLKGSSPCRIFILKNTVLILKDFAFTSTHDHYLLFTRQWLR